LAPLVVPVDTLGDIPDGPWMEVKLTEAEVKAAVAEAEAE
jgi:hypothetical protein